MTPTGTTRAIHAFAVFVLFAALANEFWLNLGGWWGIGVVVIGTGLGSVLLLVRTRTRVSVRRLPWTAMLFLAFATLSLLWSVWPGATALGLVRSAVIVASALMLGLLLTWQELATALGRTIHWILISSLLFEVWVSVVVRTPVMPFFTDWGDDPPLMAMWSRGELLTGGRIQGIVGNSNVLATAAAIGLIVFAIQIRDRRRRRAPIFGLAIALLTLALTRSATVVLALVVVAAVLGLVLWVRRTRVERRWIVTSLGVALLAALAIVGLALQSTLLAAFGKSADLTGRTEIWDTVRALIAERPVIGHGWVGNWVTWLPPFDTLVIRNGVIQGQAHSAWLDLILQLGIIGLILFTLFLLGLTVRSWWMAVDRVQWSDRDSAPYSALQLLPILVLALLLVQSVVESELLVEGALIPLFAFAIKLKNRDYDHETWPAPTPVVMAER